MKIAGKQISGPNVETIVFPRSTGDIVLQAQAVLDYDDFLTLCPTPLPPEVIHPGGERGKDINDAAYTEKLIEWAGKKTDWMVLKSLEATENLEWETVNMSDPDTFENYRQALKDAGYTDADNGRVIQTVSAANGLDQSKIDEATKRFLAGPAVVQNA